MIDRQKIVQAALPELDLSPDCHFQPNPDSLPFAIDGSLNCPPDQRINFNIEA